jgi:GH24 family phage-related lysozyme (muramidase)
MARSEAEVQAEINRALRESGGSWTSELNNLVAERSDIRSAPPAPTSSTFEDGRGSIYDTYRPPSSPVVLPSPSPSPDPSPSPAPVFDFSFDTLGGFTQDEVDAPNREAQLGAFFDDMIFDQQLGVPGGSILGDEVVSTGTGQVTMDPLTGAIDPYGMDAIASTISQLEDSGLDSFADNDSVDVGDNLDALASELFAPNRDDGVDLSGPAAAEARFGAPMGEPQTGPALPEDRDSVLLLESYEPAPIRAGKGYDTDFGGDFSSYAVTPDQSAYSTSIGAGEEDPYDPRGILPISEQVRQAIPITTQAMTDAPIFDPFSIGAEGTGSFENLLNTQPIDQSEMNVISDTIKGFEGFAGVGGFDVTADRAGYGSDTKTDPITGEVTRIEEGMTVTLEEAEADLNRRLTQDTTLSDGTVQKGFIPSVVDAVGADTFYAMDPATQAALTSIAYNYGTGWADKLPTLASAARSGDRDAIADAIAARAGDNDGINESRRLSEAEMVRTGSSSSVPPVPEVDVSESVVPDVVEPVIPDVVEPVIPEFDIRDPEEDMNLFPVDSEAPSFDPRGDQMPSVDQKQSIQQGMSLVPSMDMDSPELIDADLDQGSLIDQSTQDAINEAVAGIVTGTQIEDTDTVVGYNSDGDPIKTGVADSVLSNFGVSAGFAEDFMGSGLGQILISSFIPFGGALLQWAQGADTEKRQEMASVLASGGGIPVYDSSGNLLGVQKNDGEYLGYSSNEGGYVYDESGNLIKSDIVIPKKSVVDFGDDGGGSVDEEAEEDFTVPDMRFKPIDREDPPIVIDDPSPPSPVPDPSEGMIIRTPRFNRRFERYIDFNSGGVVTPNIDMFMRSMRG